MYFDTELLPEDERAQEAIKKMKEYFPEHTADDVQGDVFVENDYSKDTDENSCPFPYPHSSRALEIPEEPPPEAEIKIGTPEEQPPGVGVDADTEGDIQKKMIDKIENIVTNDDLESDDKLYLIKKHLSNFSESKQETAKRALKEIGVEIED